MWQRCSGVALATAITFAGLLATAAQAATPLPRFEFLLQPVESLRRRALLGVRFQLT